MLKQTTCLLIALLVIGLIAACSSNENKPGIETDGDVSGDGDPDMDAIEQEADQDEPVLDGDMEAEPDSDSEMLDGDLNADGDLDVDFEAEAERELMELADETLKIMTFNIRNGPAPDGEDAWSARRDMVTDLIQRQAPAILGVQEAWKFQIEYITDHVPGYDWLGISRGNVDGLDEYCAIFYRSELFAVRDSGTFWISDTPDVPGSMASEGQYITRITTWAKFESLNTGQTFFLFNTHFDHSNAGDVPERMAAILAKQMQAIAGDQPIILIGDFNEPIGSDAYRILTGDLTYEDQQAKLIDAWPVLGIDEEGSFHNFTGTATSSSRIDWILYSQDFTPISSELLHDHEGDRYPSDHFPITAVFGWTLAR